jgi:3-oxoisoapionate kinase
VVELLLSYYGDDLTGSTDVMEALASNGVPTVLFLRRPGAEERARFAACRAIGLAGTSRSETPEWMDEHLDPALRWLEGQRARFCHYKVCSTFDSSQRVGSIGRAIELGRAAFRQERVPLLVGAPQLGRFTAFGNLFAAYRGQVYRIDRHPVMSRHPTTPMAEADLRLHLAAQTRLKVGLVDLAALQAPDAGARVDAAFGGEEGIILLDVADAATQRAAGRELERRAAAGPLFVAGSSGIEYALLAAWRAAGQLPPPPEFPSPGRAERIAVVSGSCSPTTERQVRHAAAHGFDAQPLDPLRLLGPDGEREVERAAAAGLAALARGRSVVVHTALGPGTDVGEALDRTPGARHAVGRALGRIQRRLVAEAGLTRAVIAGGDTSSHALRELGVFALTTRLPLPRTPGSPLCTACSDEPAFDGLEIALKGGQIGGDEYLLDIRDGKA